MKAKDRFTSRSGLGKAILVIKKNVVPLKVSNVQGKSIHSLGSVGVKWASRGKMGD